jgi:hypothetical protein
MSAYNEKLQRIWHQFEEESGRFATSREVVAWGVRNGLLTTPDIDPLDILAEDMSKALREEYRKDRYGRRYRFNHAVRANKAGVQQTLWGTLDSSPRQFMEKSFAQRRKQIVGDCLQLKTDIDVFNDKNPQEEPIQVVLNFIEDVKELQSLTESKAA